MVASIVARGVVVTRGRVSVLGGVDISVSPGHRLGLVGPNGVGKSTLLRVLAGRVAPEKGEVVVTPPSATVGLLDQEPERRVDESVLGYLGRRTGVTAASVELDDATAALAAMAVGSAERYDEALTRWLHLGGADLEARTHEAVAAFDLASEVLDAPMASLSGGEAAKCSLIALLLSRFDVVLLDEPTNDLDLDGLDRLEQIVSGHPAPMVIVSHDRAFLERTISDVVELDEHTRRATTFAGGWLSYLDERATARRHAQEAFDQYAARRDELTSRAQREREWSAKGALKARRRPPDNDRSLRSLRIEQSEQLAGRARRTERALERLEVVDEPRESWQLRFTIASTARSGDLVASLQDAVVRQGSFVLGPVDLEIRWAQRVGVVGPNGSGKSTLLRALFGQVPLDAGRQRTGSGVMLGGIEQARHQLDASPSLLDAVLTATGATVADARTLLAKFGLVSDHVLRPSASLSPGERTRATMALLQGRGVNCLVLDEPTNHLDLAAIEQLESALAAFTGTVVLVSHDRRFLEAVDLQREIGLDRGRLVADTWR